MRGRAGIFYFAPYARLAGFMGYQIGGYQVLDKWLKDRKGRHLSLGDVRQYRRVVTALVRTIEIQAEIDRLYPQVEKDTLAVELPPQA